MSRRAAAWLGLTVAIGVVAAATSGVWSSAGRADSASNQTAGPRASSYRASATRHPTSAVTRGHPRSAITDGSHSPLSPGSLPQPHAYPSAHSARFKARMASLWAGIVRDSVKRALPAFFPKAAYLQLKAIGNAGSDWTDRLLHDYSLDISAAHALLGGGAVQAKLVSVDVDSSYGHWIEPGGCYNSVGYYEMPGARIVYRQAAGVIHSFGIASMISWRGGWYVVHLGAVLRSTEEGVVDEPSSGPGVPAYSGTC